MAVFEVREVVAAGLDFRPAGVFEDPGVAADEVASFRARQEPLVLRVTARGGVASERRALAGDWLCDADGSAPSRLPPAGAGLPWGYSGESWRWVEGREWLDAWESCSKGAWMAYAAAECGVNDASLGLAMCSGLRQSISRNVDPGEPRVATMLEAVRSVEAWCERGAGGVAGVARHDSAWRGTRGAIVIPNLWRTWSAVGNLLEWCLIRAAALDATAAAQAANAVGLADINDRSSPMSLALRSGIPTVSVLRSARSVWRRRRAGG